MSLGRSGRARPETSRRDGRRSAEGRDGDARTRGKGDGTARGTRCVGKAIRGGGVVVRVWRRATNRSRRGESRECTHLIVHGETDLFSHGLVRVGSFAVRHRAEAGFALRQARARVEPGAQTRRLNINRAVEKAHRREATTSTLRPAHGPDSRAPSRSRSAAVMLVSVPYATIAPAPARRPGVDRRSRGARDADGSSEDVRIASSDRAVRRATRRAAPRRSTHISAHRADAVCANASIIERPAEPARRAILGGITATVGAWAFPDAAEEEASAASATAPGAILITGANSGVGLAAAKQLAARGETVVLACRTPKKGEEARRAILEKVPDASERLVVLADAGLEMTDLRLVSDYCKAFLDSGIPLDTLVLNAGIMAVPLGRTAQGHEMHFGVNHLAHFLVQDSLRDAMLERAKRRGAAGRVVACSSIANMLPGALRIDDLDWRAREAAGKYEKWAAYAASKAQNVLLTDEIARREAPEALVANAFHPGIVTTNLVRYILPELTAENRDPEAERRTPQGRALSRMGIRDADEGAKTHVWLATAPEAGALSGKFFVDPGLEYPRGATRARLDAAQDWFLVSETDPLAKRLRLPDAFFDWRTPDNAQRLWARSREMTDAFGVR